MGWKLVREILDYCPDLPYRQFRAFMAMALDGNDATRRCMPGMDKITRQANCGQRTTERSLDGLRKRGLIKTVEPAAPGRRAVYEILPLGVTPDTELSGDSPDSMMTGDSTTPDSMVTDERPSVSRQRPSISGQRPSVSGQRPSVSGRTPDTMVADPQSSPLSSPQSSPDAADAAPSAQRIIAGFIDWDQGNGGKLSRRTKEQLARHVGELLGEGFTEQQVKRGLTEWRAAGKHAATLPSFVEAASRGHCRAVSQRQGERDALAAREMQRAMARDDARAAARRGGDAEW